MIPCIVWFGVVAQSLPEGPTTEFPALSVASVAAAAVDRDPGVRAAEAHLESAGYRLEEARAGLLPRVEMSARYTRLSEVDNRPLVDLQLDLDGARGAAASVVDPAARGLWQQQLDQLEGLGSASIAVPRNRIGFSAEVRYPVSQLVFEILPAIEARGHRRAHAELQLRARRDRVGLSAVQALLTWVRAREVSSVALRSVEATGQAARGAKARLDAGTGSRPDALRLSARWAEARGQEALARAELARSSGALRVVLGWPATAPLELGFGLEAEQEPISDVVFEGALASRPELQALGEMVRAAEAAARSAEGGILPRLSASARVDTADPNPLFVPPNDGWATTWSLTGVLEWSPDGAWARSRAAESAWAEARAAAAELAAAEDRVRIELAEGRVRLRAALERWEATRSTIEAAREAHRAVRAGYESGVYDATDLIEAQLRAEQAQLQSIEAAIALHSLRAWLLTAAGVALWKS